MPTDIGADIFRADGYVVVKNAFLRQRCQLLALVGEKFLNFPFSLLRFSVETDKLLLTFPP